MEERYHFKLKIVYHNTCGNFGKAETTTAGLKTCIGFLFQNNFLPFILSNINSWDFKTVPFIGLGQHKVNQTSEDPLIGD